ncbi:hypothetical protein C8F01DRAFT_1255738 [Mycena amicta]|nr:hypothetical protein C8F01DRAFT_1255738 [Mycena amicta]
MSSSPELPPISPRSAFLVLKPWLRDHHRVSSVPPSLQRALEWLAEADAYGRIQAISRGDREMMYRHRSPSVLYSLPATKLEKIERADMRRQRRLDFAQEASLHSPFSLEDQQQIQERRDARQRQIARRAGAPLQMKQRYRPDCCEGCGLPTVPQGDCQNPRHRGGLPTVWEPVDVVPWKDVVPWNDDARNWESSSGGVDGSSNLPEASLVDDAPPAVESNPWWYGDQRMLLIPEDDEISPPG